MAKNKIVKSIGKPLALKFYDVEQEILKKLKLHLFKDGATMHPKLLFKKEDGTYRYRINYFHDDSIVDSKIVSVKIIDEEIVISGES
jgi:hypothetical protein